MLMSLFANITALRIVHPSNPVKLAEFEPASKSSPLSSCAGYP